MRKHSNQIEPPDLVEQARLELIPSTYPKEFEAICNLRPFKKPDQKKDKQNDNKEGRKDDEEVERKDLLDYVKLELDDIVTTYKRRFSDNGRYFTHIDECIRFADAAAADLEPILDRLAKLDGTHIEILWAVAADIDPNGFAERDYMELLKQLSSTIHAMKLLTVALPFATGVSGRQTRSRQATEALLPSCWRHDLTVGIHYSRAEAAAI